MSKPPGGKQGYVRVLRNNVEVGRTEMGLFYRTNEDTVSFVGHSINADGERVLTEIDFPRDNLLLRSVGKPRNTASKNMTSVLRVHIEAAKSRTSVSSAAATMAGSSRDVYFLARKSTGPYVRTYYEGELEGIWHAYAFMHDGIERSHNPTGPHWVLRDGDSSAVFNSDVPWTIPD